MNEGKYRRVLDVSKKTCSTAYAFKGFIEGYFSTPETEGPVHCYIEFDAIQPLKPVSLFVERRFFPAVQMVLENITKQDILKDMCPNEDIGWHNPILYHPQSGKLVQVYCKREPAILTVEYSCGTFRIPDTMEVIMQDKIIGWRYLNEKNRWVSPLTEHPTVEVGVLVRFKGTSTITRGKYTASGMWIVELTYSIHGVIKLILCSCEDKDIARWMWEG